MLCHHYLLEKGVVKTYWAQQTPWHDGERPGGLNSGANPAPVTGSVKRSRCHLESIKLNNWEDGDTWASLVPRSHTTSAASVLKLCMKATVALVAGPDVSIRFHLSYAVLTRAGSWGEGSSQQSVLGARLKIQRRSRSLLPKPLR